MAYAYRGSSAQAFATNRLFLEAFAFLVSIQLTPAQAQPAQPGVINDLPVRVNSTANLEALLYVIVNSSELLGLVGGLILICNAVFRAKSDFVVPRLKWRLIRRNQFLVGFALIVIALAIPGTINWFFFNL